MFEEISIIDSRFKFSDFLSKGLFEQDRKESPKRDGEINILKCVIKNRMRLGSITDKFSLESTRLGVNKRQKRATSLE